MAGSESAPNSGGFLVKNILSHISTKLWSDYTAADYTIEQWHIACLIHQHNGPPTAKGQCKLPVKTPNGAINKYGVYAAAAALDGARGGVNASDNEKATAAHALIKIYKDMGQYPPTALLNHSDVKTRSIMDGREGVDDILAHYGKRGMHWGRHSSAPSQNVSEASKPGVVTIYTHPQKGIVKTTGGEHTPVSEDAKRAATFKQVSRKSSIDALSTKQLQEMFTRIDLEQKYSRLNPSTTKQGINFLSKMLKNKEVRSLVVSGIKVGTLVRNDPRASTGQNISDALDQVRAANQKKKKKK